MIGSYLLIVITPAWIRAIITLTWTRITGFRAARRIGMPGQGQLRRGLKDGGRFGHDDGPAHEYQGS